ncbi:MAG TPA: hypothetical protein VLV16_13350 [Gemmatimonadales bacterium]|nr:hypothetical protein [Gemmatimonadales bacterium]
MTRTIQAAVVLATSAFFMIPVAVTAQGAPASQAAAAPAQPAPTVDDNIKMMREDIRAKRKQIVAANMTLTADEATKFWPLYDQYTAEVRKINDTRWAMMKDYAAAKGQMTDAQAKDHMMKSAQIDADLIALRMKYMPQFEKLVSPKKVVQFYQIDRRIDLYLNLQLASLIPVIDPTN